METAPETRSPGPFDSRRSDGGYFSNTIFFISLMVGAVSR